MTSNTIWTSCKPSSPSLSWRILMTEWPSATMVRSPSRSFRNQPPRVSLSSTLWSSPTAACHSWTDMRPPGRCAISGTSWALIATINPWSMLLQVTLRSATSRRPWNQEWITSTQSPWKSSFWLIFCKRWSLLTKLLITSKWIKTSSDIYNK